jgi:hypothetical protein
MAPAGGKKGRDPKEGDAAVLDKVPKDVVQDDVVTAGVIVGNNLVVEAAVGVAVTPEKPREFYVIDMAKRTFVRFVTMEAAEEFLKNIQSFSPSSAKSLRVSGFQSEREVVSFLDNFSKLNPVGAKQPSAQRS